jgi:tRNA threonylcarbamoyladenosine biosynthesis protein TsaE
MQEFMCTNVKETEALASKLHDVIMSRVSENKNNKAVVVALSGDLGSGKTTLTQYLLKNFGVTEQVTSPTFVIQKIYRTEKYNLVHIDAYRLESARELSQLNWQELIQDSKNIIVIEWPEKVIELIPEDAIKVSCQFVDEGTRKYTF